MTQLYGVIGGADILLWGAIPLPVKEDHTSLFETTGITHKKVGIELDPLYKEKEATRKGRVFTPPLFFDLHDRLAPNNTMVYAESTSDVDQLAAYAETTHEKELSPLDTWKIMARTGYHTMVARPHAIREQLRQHRPDIAYLSASIAYQLRDDYPDSFFEINATEKEDLEHIQYLLDSSTDDEMFHQRLENHRWEYTLARRSELPRDSIAEFEKERSMVPHLQRVVHLIDHGRFRDNATPDYVGTWHLDKGVPAEGFFEVYVTHRDGKLVRGTIVDALGDAEFEGTIDPERAVFTKRYTTSFEALQPLQGDIVYQGHRVAGSEGMYHGQFVSSPLGSRGREFVLKAYRPGVEREILDANSQRDLVML